MNHFFTGIFIMLCFSTLCKAQSGYNFSEKIALQGDGSWDYLQIDESANRLFVTHDDRVHIISLTNRKEVGTIYNLHGAHHVTVIPELNKFFVSNGKNNTVSVYNYTTLDSITTIHIDDENPDPMCYDVFSKKLYVFCDNDKAVLIDPTDNHITGTIALGGAPDFALSTGKGLIYNNLEGTDETNVIDVVKQKVIKRFPLPKHSAPTGMAFDEKNNRLFVVCRGINKMAVLDASNGKVITLLSIEGNVDGLYFDHLTKLIFCSGGSGKTTVIKQLSKDSYKVIDKLVTKVGTKTMELNPVTHDLYFAAASFVSGTNLFCQTPFVFLFLNGLAATLRHDPLKNSNFKQVG
ncbi:MAG: YncE family protein [Chitinophagaceae bacterium]